MAAVEPAILVVSSIIASGKGYFKMDYNASDSGQSEYGTAIDLGTVLGTWVNSNTETRWIEKFILTQRDEQIIMHAYGSQSTEDWGEIEVTLYVDHMYKENAFCAHYDRESVESILATNLSKGLYVIAGFHKFKNSSETDFCREFYYRLN